MRISSTWARLCYQVQDPGRPGQAVKYIGAESEVDAVEMHEPHTYLNSLTTEDLEDLFEDIKVYQSPEKGTNADFW